VQQVGAGLDRNPYDQAINQRKNCNAVPYTIAILMCIRPALKRDGAARSIGQPAFDHRLFKRADDTPHGSELS
jgi:hypothetical protein